MSTIYDSRSSSFAAAIQADAEPIALAPGFDFLEGPAWAPDGSVLFSDIPGNRIMRWSRHGVDVHVANSHFSIGLYREADGAILACEHSRRRLVRYGPDGGYSVIAEFFEGQALNSPNDVTTDPAGHVYFTDPPFGARVDDHDGLTFYQVGMEQSECRVFRVGADSEHPVPVVEGIYRPNGLVFSPNGETLYVGDSSAQFRALYAARRNGDGTFGAPEQIAVLPDGVPDGMRVDVEGRLWVCSGNHLWVYAPEGELLGSVEMPELVTNLTFGGENGSTLAITGLTTLWSLQTRAIGDRAVVTA